MFGFLAIGVMAATLNCSGNSPVSKDRLNSRAMNGLTRSATCFSIDVGIGSAGDDLIGSRRIEPMTSSTEIRLNVPKRASNRISLNDGGGAPRVSSRTRLTFSSKNLRNSSAEMVEEVG
jgi:hypothetical protein